MCRPRRAPLVRLTRQGLEGARLAVVSRPDPASLAAWRASQVHEVILSGAASDCKRKDRIIGRSWTIREPMLPKVNSRLPGESPTHPGMMLIGGAARRSQRFACSAPGADA